MIQRLADIQTNAIAAFEKESKRLLVRWENDLLTLALAEKETGLWQAAELFKYDIVAEDFVADLKQKSTLANYTGLQTEVFVATPQVLLLPTKLVDGAALFLQTQFGKKEEASIFTHTISEAITAGFLLENTQQTTIETLLPQANIKSSLGLQVQQLLGQTDNDTPILQICLGNNLAEMVFVDKGKLLVARSFSFTAPEDVLYHLLNACRVLGILPQAVQVTLQGQVQEQNGVYQLLHTCFSTLQFAAASPALQQAAFSQVPLHYFTPLIQPV